MLPKSVWNSCMVSDKATLRGKSNVLSCHVYQTNGAAINLPENRIEPRLHRLNKWKLFSILSNHACSCRCLKYNSISSAKIDRYFRWRLHILVIQLRSQNVNGSDIRGQKPRSTCCCQTKETFDWRSASKFSNQMKLRAIVLTDSVNINRTIK